jgi:hypothetical protein
MTKMWQDDQATDTFVERLAAERKKGRLSSLRHNCI